MKRIVWLGVGVAVGVVAYQKIARARSLASPGGINRAVASLADSVADFAGQVREGMSEREAELRKGLGLTD
ncbi:hypothetical protein SCMU_21900 [Sinomonas cyclohexanicum]|uniref:Secreted protein n=1 Tax=Sinomonas cyclohexanicum TaxID=322009 RepID=A0ABM7PWE4_SINCY|nr:hypothetical protein [Corynebacterium cyclohexanicum]BCT76348.1 hypothetical protein SCMU_21900 [Corynebacterium cyclohexanicum]